MQAAPVAPRVAVIGGGVAGSLCSLVLRQHGAEPVLFDMGRRSLGGRMGTLSSSSPGRPDRGAQFFCVSDAGSRFAQVVGFFERNGLVAPWDGRFGVLGARGGGFLPKGIIDGSVPGGLRAGNTGGGEEKVAAAHPEDFCGFLAGGSGSKLYTGVPSMAALCGRLASMAKVPVRQGAHVSDLRLDAGVGWSVVVDGGNATDGDERFDAVVVASHNPALAGGVVSSLAEGMAEKGSAAEDEQRQLVLMAERLRGLAGSLQNLRAEHRMALYACTIAVPNGSLSAHLPFDAVSLPTSPHVQFLAREASKPGRTTEGAPEEFWTAISTPAFAKQLLAAGADEAVAGGQIANHVADVLRPTLPAAVAEALDLASGASAKRWNAGLNGHSLGLHEDSVGLEPWRLAICGDFVRDHPSPLEAAVLSGMDAGERVISWFSDQGSAQ